MATVTDYQPTLGDFEFDTSAIMNFRIWDTPEWRSEVEAMAAVVVSHMLDLDSEESIISAKYDITQGIHEMFGDLTNVFNPEYENTYYFTFLKLVMEDQIEWETIAEPYFKAALDKEREYRMGSAPK